jgi:hypothetical protein
VTDPALHRRENVLLDPGNVREMALRRPVTWLDSVRSPLHVFEGASGPVGNVDELRAMQAATRNPQIQFHPVGGADHFSVLAPTNRLVARRILEDTGSAATMTFASKDLEVPFRRLGTDGRDRWPIASVRFEGARHPTRCCRGPGVARFRRDAVPLDGPIDEQDA